MKQSQILSVLVQSLLWGLVIICFWQSISFFYNIARLDNIQPLTIDLRKHHYRQDNDTNLATISYLFNKNKISDNKNTLSELINKSVIFPDIKLQGTIVNSNPNKSLAIIMQANKQSMLGIGEKITATEAAIYQILDDSIIIQQEGQKKTIYLKINELASRATSQSASSPKFSSPSKITTDIQNFRETLANNPSAIAHYVSFNPVFTDGKTTGYRLSPRGDEKIFHLLGLQKNDVAYAISGSDFYVKLSDAKALAGLWGKMQQIDSFTLHLKRNDQKHEVVISLR